MASRAGTDGSGRGLSARVRCDDEEPQGVCEGRRQVHLSERSVRPRHALDDALSSADRGRALCAELAECGYAVVVVPERLRPLIIAVRRHAAAFFALDDGEKERVGNFARVGGTSYAGFRRERQTRSEFLELHCDGSGTLHPRLPAQLPELASAACALSWALLGVSPACPMIRRFWQKYLIFL